MEKPPLPDSRPTAEGSGPLVVDEVKGIDALAALEEEWRSFVERAPTASFFYTWEWLTARLESYWADDELALLWWRRQGRLVAAAPFVVDRDAEQWVRRAR